MGSLPAETVLVMRRLLAVFTALAVLLALVVPGWSGGATSHPTFDGRTLMRGVFFGVGPVAQRLSPDLRSLNAGVREGVTKSSAGDIAIEKLLSQVETLDPAFMAHFAKVVNTGDYVGIRDALGRGGTLLKQAVKVAYPQVGISGSVEHRFFVFGPVAIAVAAVLAGVAVVIGVLGLVVVGNVFIYIQKVVTTYQFTSKLKPSKLAREQLVSTIVADLAR